MKPFKKKYTVFKRTDDFEALVAFYTKDRRGNYLPMFFDDPAHAVLAIAARMSAVAQAALGDKKVDLNDAFGYFVANAELDKDGLLSIYTIPDGADGASEDEFIYEDHYNNLVKDKLNNSHVYHLFPA